MNRLLARMSAIASVKGWLMVAVVYVVTLGASIRNLWHWGPDTRYYLAMTYRYSGMSEHEAGRRTYEYLGRFPWFKDYCYFACDPNSPDATFGHLFHGEAGGMVATRVVYPLLSVPFVWLLGPQGMLVVPFLAYTASIVMIMVLVSRSVGPKWTVLAGVALILPTSVSGYALYTYTEALAMAFVFGCLIVLPLARAATRRDLVVYGLMLMLVAFTRQFHYIVVAAVGLAWLGGVVFRRKLRNEWLPFLGVSMVVVVIAAVAQSLAGPDYSIISSFMSETGVSSMADVPLAAAQVTASLIRHEMWVLTTDLPLAVICLFAAFGIVYRLRSSLAALTLGAVLGSLMLNVLNTASTNFRYYVTAFPLITMMAVVTIADLTNNSNSPHTDNSPAPVAEPPVASTDPIS